MIWLMVATLFLHPVIDEPAEMRLVAAGTDGPSVWLVDGVEVARLEDRQIAVVEMDAGAHVVQVLAEGSNWTAMMRPERAANSGLNYVPAWIGRATTQLEEIPLVLHEPMPATEQGVPEDSPFGWANFADINMGPEPTAGESLPHAQISAGELMAVALVILAIGIYASAARAKPRR